jgi:3-phenylpropionate/trans-cinnamate dioxygenase ferredoxin component
MGEGMENFVEVVKVDDVPPGSATVVDVKGVEIALVNSGGEYFAIGNECPHAGGPLGEGDLVEENQLECPLHGSVFDITTGEPVVGPADEPVPTYPTKVSNGVVSIAVD